MKAKKLFLYLSLCLIISCLGGCATCLLNYKIEKNFYSAQEFADVKEVLKKYPYDAEIDGKTNEIYYGYKFLRGNQRIGYVVIYRDPITQLYDNSYILTENINKYKLLKSATEGCSAIFEYHGLIINGKSSNHKAVDLEWIARSHTQHILLSSMYILTVPIDIATFPIQFAVFISNPF